jgi:hypothetical protein
MSASIHPSSEIHVTGVTRVTTFAKCPYSLACPLVTHLSDFTYTPCNASLACNAKLSPRLLRAGARRPWLKRDSRWLRQQNAGRGIARYTLGNLGDD